MRVPRPISLRAALFLGCLQVLAGVQPAYATFQTFTTADGLAQNSVQVIYEDAEGLLYFGAQRGLKGGLSIFDGATWATFDSTAAELPGNSVYDILRDSRGALWVGTNNGVGRLDANGWEAFGTTVGLPAGAIVGVVQDSSGAVWFRGPSGLGVTRFDGSTWTRFDATNGLSNDVVNTMRVDRTGTLWIGTNGGVGRYDGTSWAWFTSADGLAGNTVQALIDDRSGALWFATLQGVSRYDGVTWTNFTTADGLPSNSSSVLLEAANGDVWVGTELGAARYDGAGWQGFTYDDGLAADVVSVVAEDSRGFIWLASPSSTTGITRYDGVGLQIFTIADGLAADHATAILRDREGNMWFGTASPGQGVTRYDGEDWRSFRVADGVANISVRAVSADGAGRVWAATPTGASMYDGALWRTFTVADGLASNDVSAVLADRSGIVWFGTALGVTRFDGATWFTDPALADHVQAIFEDAQGRHWFGTQHQGVALLNGTTWTTYGTSNSPIVSNDVVGISQDRAGNLWFATDRGVSRFDGTTWTRFTSADGLARDVVLCVASDSAGVTWFGTNEGLSRFDGTTWTTFTEAQGLPSRVIQTLHVDEAGALWLGTIAGASRYDGERVVSFAGVDGLAGDRVFGIARDPVQRLWFATFGGVSRFERDRVPPRAVIIPKPATVSASRTASIPFRAAFGESDGITYSYSFDGEPWSAWTTGTSPSFFLRSGILDGPHMFDLRARDALNNLQAAPTRVTFEIDATPPAPVLTSPGFGIAVTEMTAIEGTAADDRFAGYTVQVRPTGASSWASPATVTLAQSATPVTGDTLANWNTSGWNDGDYELRVLVADTLGLVGAAQIAVIVDNVFPFVDQTSPVRIVAAAGGNVFTTGSEVHAFFPPNAFDRDAIVTIEPGTGPDSLDATTRRVSRTFGIGWQGATLEKSATLTMSGRMVPGLSRLPVPGAGAELAVYAAGSDSIWHRVGGTFEPADSTLSLALASPGRYAVFAETAGAPPLGRMLSALSLTPRIFSPNGHLSNTRIGIGFTLGQAAPVTVKIYNRAGRLVREIASGTMLGAGANLVYWDGRNRDGDNAREGLYLVTVEAMDEKQTSTLAVVH